tara:strand:+ start:271 stop:1116 length:846 start_codon:yes stop_codon:yes gene_type:complete
MSCLTKETIDRLEKKLRNVYVGHPKHLHEAAAGIVYACLKHEININKLLDEVESGAAFSLEEFWESTEGNLLTYLKNDYQLIAQDIINITAGGTGGMASVGKGEFFISFFSNFKIKIITSNGDISYKGKNEEVKYNGGKIAVSQVDGKEIYSIFTELIENSGIQIKKEDFVPSRKADIDEYSTEDYNKLLGYYWQAISESSQRITSRKEFFLLCLEKALDHEFQTIDSLLVISEKNNFVRFNNKTEAYNYYSEKPKLLRKWEIRTKQKNPVAMYAKLEEEE